MQFLIRECKRAGTVAILHGHTFDSLSELKKLRSSLIEANGRRFFLGKLEKGDFELSHIQPVKNSHFFGLLHPRNLVIATSSYNRTRSSKEAPAQSGMRIPKRGNCKHSLCRAKSKDAIAKRIKSFLGKELVHRLSTEIDWTNSTEYTYTQKLLKLGYKESALEKRSVAALLELLAQHGISIPQHGFEGRSVRDVLVSELKRCGHENHPLLPYLEAIEHSRTFTTYYSSIKLRCIDPEGFIFHLFKQAQNLLHGEPVVMNYLGVPYLYRFIYARPDKEPRNTLEEIILDMHRSLPGPVPPWESIIESEVAERERELELSRQARMALQGGDGDDGDPFG